MFSPGLVPDYHSYILFKVFFLSFRASRFITMIPATVFTQIKQNREQSLFVYINHLENQSSRKSLNLLENTKNISTADNFSLERCHVASSQRTMPTRDFLTPHVQLRFPSPHLNFDFRCPLVIQNYLSPFCKS